MDFLETRIHLDMQSDQTALHITVRRNDTARRLRFYLSDGAKPYEISPDCSAKLRIRKPLGYYPVDAVTVPEFQSGTYFFRTGTSYVPLTVQPPSWAAEYQTYYVFESRCTEQNGSVENNGFVFSLGEEEVDTPGECQCEVVIFGQNEEKLTSQVFGITVEPTVETTENQRSQTPYLRVYTYDADATQDDIRTGKTAYVNAKKLVGTYDGVDTQDATATAADIAAGKTAYVATGQVVGTNEDMKNLVEGNAVTLVLPDTVEKIGKYCFAENQNVIISSLPDSIKTVDEFGFYNCTGLRIQQLPQDLETVYDYAFSGCANMAVSALPAGLKNIEFEAFFECTGMSVSALPEGLEQLANGAFSGCTGITVSVLPQKIRQINPSVFSDCSSMTELTALGDVIGVNYRCFYGCSSLEKIRFPNNTSVPYLYGTDVFDGMPANFRIFVPDNLLNTWKAQSKWSSLASHIFPLSDEIAPA